MNAVTTIEPRQESGDSRTLMLLIERLATMPELDMERLDKLMQMKKEWDANEARKAFTAAMAAFKANPPEILKDRHVEYTSERTGKKTEYDHATLGAACSAIIKGLSAVGISHRWDLAQSDNRIKVTCVLTHALGHGESVSLIAGPDDSGGKNAIQAVASCVSYLERYTLFAATGLSSADMDDDGQAAGARPKEPTITEEQIKSLEKLINGGGGDMAKALRFMKLASLSEIPAKNYDAVLKDIQAVNKARARARVEK